MTASSKTDVKAVQTVKKPIGMVRFRVPKKSECFIAPGPDTYDVSVSISTQQCRWGVQNSRSSAFYGHRSLHVNNHHYTSDG